MSHPGSEVWPRSPNFSKTMAKKIITEETPKADEQVIQTTEEVQAATTEIPAEETPQTENKQDELAKESDEPNPHILATLKKFPAYESLYIDTHGGTYTPNTPAAIRGKAVLYKNPYFNELKKK